MPDPKVGVGVLIWKDSGDHFVLLVGKRLGSHGEGEYALPGGHLEWMESFEECASRELKEETGIDIPPAQFTFAYAVNSVWEAKCFFDANGMTEGLQKEAHYATIFMETFCSPLNKEPQTLEPLKCEGWMWVKYDDIPRPLFQPLARLLTSKGYRPPSKNQEDENCRKLEIYE